MAAAHPDLILANASVITMDPAVPRARSIVISEGKIVSVSGNEAIPARKKNTHVIDCAGRTVIPGLTDAHCHLPAYAEALVSLDLSPRGGIRSLADIQGKIRSAAQESPPGTWIRGKGYNEFYLTEQRHPNRHDLDAVSFDHPIKLTHRSGHAHVLNTLALQLVGVTMETADPPDGLIERDLETGEPNGIVYGMSGYLAKKIPPLDDEEMKHGVKLANDRLLSSGITSIQDTTAHNDRLRWSMFQRWKDHGVFKPRVTMMLGVKGFSESRRKSFASFGNEDQLRVGGVKIIIHEITGSLHPTPTKLKERVHAIHKAGLQVVLHAIEEAAIEAACDAIEYALKRNPRSDHRHRIEHCSVCPPPLAERLHSLGIVVVTHPSFIFYNGDRYLKTVPPEELPYLYPIGTLRRQGIMVAAGSDFPITDPNPIVGIYAAMTRQAESGAVVLPHEGIGLVEAFTLYTSAAAAANFEETVKGSITPGKLADLVILGGNLDKLPVEEIKSLPVDMTILNGEVLWERSI